MKKVMLYISLFCVFAAAFCFGNAANAGDSPDGWVKGLWIQAAGLPKDAVLEDYSDGDDEKPWFVYSWGKGSDGPAVTLGVGRFPPSAGIGEKLLNLDKKVLREFIGSEAFWESPDAKKLTFTEAPEKISAGLTYPCQVVRYSESDMGLSHMVLFMETDPFLFMAEITWETADKNFKKSDGEKILANLSLVEREGMEAAAPDGSAFSLKDGRLFRDGEIVEAEVNEVPAEIEGPVRFWSAVGADESGNETGVRFFAEDGAFLAFLPLESADECRGIMFSPDGSFFLLMSGSGVRADMTYILYEAETMEAKIEIPGVRESAAWIDAGRFVMTRIDDVRETESGTFSMAALRLSAVMYDTVAEELAVLKEATATKNYWCGGLADDGASIVISEDSVTSEKDWGDEEKITTREIKIEIPAAG
jgi:hypothetical protein